MPVNPIKNVWILTEFYVKEGKEVLLNAFKKKKKEEDQRKEKEKYKEKHKLDIKI